MEHYCIQTRQGRKKCYIRNVKRKTRIDDILAAQNKGNISHRTDFYFVRINLKGQKSSEVE